MPLILKPDAPLGKVAFRPARDADREFLFRLFCETREWEFRYSTWSPADKADFLDRQFTARDLHYRMAFPGASYSIIQLDGGDIGAICLERQDDCLRIIDFTIAAAFCGRGIGSDILRALMHEAAGGKVPVRLSALKDSPPLRLYRRLGFTVTGDLGHHLSLEWRPPTGPREI